MFPKIVIVIAGLLFSYSDGPRLSAQSRPAAPRPAAPARRPPAAAPTGPLKLSEVIEALYSLGSVRKVEDLVVKRGVSFQAVPDTVALLKEFGATDKLLSLIPPPPVAPRVQPKYAGPFNVVCAPVDCMVVVNDKFYGSTLNGKTAINDLPPGEAAVHVFSDGYERGTQQVSLQANQPSEIKFLLEQRSDAAQGIGTQFLLDAVRALGGIETMSLLIEFQGEGSLEWTDAAGQVQRWPLTFSKRPGTDMTMVFKTRDGECSTTVSGSTSTPRCKGQLRAFEGFANQAATSFLKYQVQNVVDELLTGTAPLMGNETSRSAEGSNRNGTYVLSFDSEKLPSELFYTPAAAADSALQVTYSNYVNLNGGRFPGQMEIRSTDKAPIMLFTLTSVRTRLIQRP